MSPVLLQWKRASHAPDIRCCSRFQAVLWSFACRALDTRRGQRGSLMLHGCLLIPSSSTSWLCSPRQMRRPSCRHLCGDGTNARLRCVCGGSDGGGSGSGWRRPRSHQDIHGNKLDLCHRNRRPRTLFGPPQHLQQRSGGKLMWPVLCQRRVL